MHQTRANLIFLISFVTALFCAGTVLFFIHVIRNKNEHSSAVLATLENKIEEKNNIGIVHKEIAGIKAVDDMASSHLVNPDKINAFVDYLGAFGVNTDTQVTVKDIKLAPKDKNSIITSIFIVGTFANVEKTIALLENDTYQIHITNLSLGENIPLPQALASSPKSALSSPSVLPAWQADVSFTVLSSS